MRIEKVLNYINKWIRKGIFANVFHIINIKENGQGAHFDTLLVSPTSQIILKKKLKWMCVGLYICIQRNKPVNGISISIYSTTNFISKPLVLPI